MLKNIIFSGGGLKGWAYIGTIQALSEYINFNDLEQVIGVSIGSIFGLFYVLGIKWHYLLDFVLGLNIPETADINLDSIFTNQSLFEGIKFKNIIKTVMSSKIDPDITFMELYRYSGILFTVNALNVDSFSLKYFNYQETPEIKVIDAVMASCSIPLVFPPYCIHGEYYYDGGICNNCPSNLVDPLDSIAFDLNTQNEKFNSSFKFVNMLWAMSLLINKSNNSNSEIIHQILDSRFTKEMLNFHQSRDDIFNIYMTGYINSKNIILSNVVALPDVIG